MDRYPDDMTTEEYLELLPSAVFARHSFLPSNASCLAYVLCGNALVRQSP